MERFIRLVEIMGGADGWGRAQGRVVYQKLVSYVEARPTETFFRISMEGVERLSVSFVSESIIELVRRYRGSKGICLVDLDDADLIDDIDAAAARVEVPIIIWTGKAPRVVGIEPSAGNREAFAFALARPQARASEFAESVGGMSIANASTKFKQLWQQGFLMRTESAADSGGVEFIYQRIG
jgi:hypothetical protein